jgi:hypothetical protein
VLHRCRHDRVSPCSTSGRDLRHLLTPVVVADRRRRQGRTAGVDRDPRPQPGALGALLAAGRGGGLEPATTRYAPWSTPRGRHRALPPRLMGVGRHGRAGRRPGRRGGVEGAGGA